jgi:hypothetical protein
MYAQPMKASDEPKEIYIKQAFSKNSADDEPNEHTIVRSSF